MKTKRFNPNFKGWSLPKNYDYNEQGKRPDQIDGDNKNTGIIFIVIGILFILIILYLLFVRLYLKI